MTTKLDVRPMLAAGEEPFSTIMSVVDGMSEGERFELVAPFDPVPLYEVLGPRGFHHRTEKRGPGEYVVEFVQTGITAESTVREVLDRHPATAELLAEAARAAGVSRLRWRGAEVDPFAEPERLTLSEAFARYAEIDLMAGGGATDRGPHERMR